MQDWMILVLAIAVLGATFVVISRDKLGSYGPRLNHPTSDYTWGSASEDEQDEQDDDVEDERKTDTSVE